MIFERLLVFLQNRPADEAVLKNLGNLFDRIGVPNELVFYHISQDYNLPHLKFSKTGFSKKSVHQSIEASLQKKLDQNVSSDMDYELIVEEGHPVNGILKLCSEKAIELVVLSAARAEGDGLNIRQFSRHSPASILILSEVNPLNFDNLLVPIDCSEHSKLILEGIKEEPAFSKGSKIRFLNVYPRPSSFYKSGMNIEEFSKISKSNAEEEVGNFLSGLDLQGMDYESSVMMDPGHDIAKTILDSGKKAGAGLLIVGSKGKTGMASILLGSVTEKLLESKEERSILIIKHPMEQMGLMKALKQV